MGLILHPLSQVVQDSSPPHLCLPEELGGLLAAEGPSLTEHVVPSPSATPQTPVSLPEGGLSSPPNTRLSVSLSPDPSLCFPLCRASVA